jgi:hypothetical protein
MPVGRISTVVVFIIGGSTYEEAAKVAALNLVEGNPRIVLGGTMVLNSKRWVAPVVTRAAVPSVPSHVPHRR